MFPVNMTDYDLAEKDGRQDEKRFTTHLLHLGVLIIELLSIKNLID